MPGRSPAHCHVELDDVSTGRARAVEVDCPGINAYADGDFACPLPVTVSAVPGALRILTPTGQRGATRLRGSAS